MGVKQKIQHDKALELYLNGCKDQEIADIFGTSKSAITLWRQRNNLLPHFYNRKIPRTDRIGEIRTMNSGLQAKIIAYREAHDIDIEFPDGIVITSRKYSDFVRGKIISPLVINYVDNYAEVSNPNIKSRPTWLMDIDDIPILNNFMWYISSSTGYVECSNVNQKSLHRLIMNAKQNEQVDHINGIRTDNRKCNLRICTAAENRRNQGLTKRNKSGYKGVMWDKAAKKWRASIVPNKKYIHLGYFDTAEQAAFAYNAAAIKHYGEFARLNIIGGSDNGKICLSACIN